MEMHRDKPFTLEDLYDLPDDGNRYELHRGFLVAEPSPGARHGCIELLLGSALLAHVRALGNGKVMTNVSFVLARDPDTVRVPDIAYVRQDRYDTLTDDVRPVPFAPDLAVEVLSPSYAEAQMQLKIADYLMSGTQMVWVIDPAHARVMTHAAGGGRRELGPADELTGDPMLPGFALAVREIFNA